MRLCLIFLSLSFPLSHLWSQGPVQNRAADIFFGPEISDARAVWVNPASLGLVPSASVMANITTLLPFEDGSRVSQWTLGLSSRGFSFGYQHDEFGGDRARDTYRLGFGGGVAPLAVGGAIAFHRGIGKGVSGDIGAIYQASRYVLLSGVLANIGQPDLGVSDEFELPFTVRPVATFLLANGRASLSAGAAFSTDSLQSVGAGLRLQPLPQIPFTAIARFDLLGSDLDQGRITLGISWGRLRFLQGSVTTPDSFDQVGLLSVTGVAVQPMGDRSR